MITDAEWSDLDNDGDIDIVIVGEYMPITILENVEGEFINNTSSFNLGNTNGWWNDLSVSDLDKSMQVFGTI